MSPITNKYLVIEPVTAKMEESILENRLEGCKVRCSNCYINAGYLTSLSIQIPPEDKVIFSLCADWVGPAPSPGGNKRLE